MIKRIEVITGMPGCGKSKLMIEKAAAIPGKYLFAVPTIDLIKEQCRFFRNLNPTTKIWPIHSKNEFKTKVGRQIDDLLNLPSNEHTAAWITHEALLDHSFDDFSDWHIRIDEPVNAVTAGQFKSISSLSTFKTSFNLVPVQNSNWSQLTPVNSNQNWAKLSKDVLWANLVDFHKFASRVGGVFVNAENWNSFGSGQKLDWVSYWSPETLKVFKTAQIAGSSYLSSLGYKAFKKISPTEKPSTIQLSRNYSSQPNIEICYFTDAHHGSTTFWNVSDGRHCLAKIGWWLAANEPDLGYWSGNEPVRNSLEHRIHGQLASPKLAGQNSYRALSSCAFFYSSKPLPQDCVLKEVFEITDADIKLAREFEDIFQFVMRGEIRNPEYNGPYKIFLYSKDQADALSHRFAECGFLNVAITAIDDAGIMDYERSKCSKTNEPSHGEVDSKVERRRAQGRKRTKNWRAKKLGK